MNNFDYIVVGAGSSGAAVAARLAETNKFNVLLIEAGGSDFHPWIHIPIGVGKILTNPRFVWSYYSEAEKELNGKKIYLPRGKIIGGSSSINGMLFVRGAPHKYDEWRNGNEPGWGYEELLPYFKKLEDWKISTNSQRGKGGPIKISRGNYKDILSTSFRHACLQDGAKATDDYNIDFDGVSWLQYTTYNGRRSSTSTSYLKNAYKYKKLKILKQTEVTKILIKNNSAVGIEAVCNNRKMIFHSNLEIILSAGPINSPKLLELSGIGNAKLLKKHDIPVVKELNGVGENLIDHFQTRITYETSLKVTVNDILNNPFRGLLESVRYLIKKNGLMSIASATVHCLSRSNKAKTYPDLKLQMMLISGNNRYARSKKIGLDPFSGFSIGVFPLYPESRGSTHIKSSLPHEKPSIIGNYLNHKKDKELTIAGLKKIRAVMNKPSISKYVLREVRPGKEVRSDKDLLDFSKDTGQTSWHQVGTCRMGNSKNDVVDFNLKVHGIKNLRIIDSSIMPNMPTSNTNAPSIVIGEKGADLILNKSTK